MQGFAVLLECLEVASIDGHIQGSSWRKLVQLVIFKPGGDPTDVWRITAVGNSLKVGDKGKEQHLSTGMMYERLLRICQSKYIPCFPWY